MWCAVLVGGLVRVQVSDLGQLAAGAPGSACGGGRGECADPSACAVVVPKWELQAWALPQVAWCFQGLACCAEKRPEFSGTLRLPDGRTTTLRVHDHMTAGQLYEMADEALAEEGDVPDYKLEVAGGRVLDRQSGETLKDLNLAYPRHFELSASLRLRGGIAHGETPPWAHVPFVVKLQATYTAVDPEDNVLKRYQSSCTGALVGPYVFSAAHCFQGKTSDPSVWTALVYRPAAATVAVGDAVVVWNDSGDGKKRDAVVTGMRRWPSARIEALPVGWSGYLASARGFVWDHIETASQQTLAVTSIRNHDLYDAKTDTHDFAVLEVSGPGFLPPRPPLLDAQETQVGRPVLFAGFGQREDGESGELRTAQLDTERCPAFEAQSHQTVRCASSGPFSPVSTCVGDSGGPVFYPAGSHAVHGLASWQMKPRTAVGEHAYVLTASNSFGYMAGCGDPLKKTGVSMLARNRAFLEQVVPADRQTAWFTWV
jgi:hypothetical protein